VNRALVIGGVAVAGLLVMGGVAYAASRPKVVVAPRSNRLDAQDPNQCSNWIAVSDFAMNNIARTISDHDNPTPWVDGGVYEKHANGKWYRFTMGSGLTVPTGGRDGRGVTVEVCTDAAVNGSV
jgi:hypothetical protein